MSTINFQLPDALHRKARELAELITEDYLGERAKRGSRAKFEKAMAKVADVEPEEYDRL
jgi:hypothetical protein